MSGLHSDLEVVFVAGNVFIDLLAKRWFGQDYDKDAQIVCLMYMSTSPLLD